MADAAHVYDSLKERAAPGERGGSRRRAEGELRALVPAGLPR